MVRAVVSQWESQDRLSAWSCSGWNLCFLVFSHRPKPFLLGSLVVCLCVSCDGLMSCPECTPPLSSDCCRYPMSWKGKRKINGSEHSSLVYTRHFMQNFVKSATITSFHNYLFHSSRYFTELDNNLLWFHVFVTVFPFKIHYICYFILTDLKTQNMKIQLKKIAKKCILSKNSYCIVITLFIPISKTTYQFETVICLLWLIKIIYKQFMLWT